MQQPTRFIQGTLTKMRRIQTLTPLKKLIKMNQKSNQEITKKSELTLFQSPDIKKHHP